MGLVGAVLQAGLVSFGFLAALFLFYGFHIRQRFLLRHIPGPKPKFFLGNWSKDFQLEFQHTFLSWPKIYGPCYKYFMGKDPLIVLTDPELVLQLTSKNFKVFHDRKVPPYLTPITKLDEERLTWDMIWAKGKYWQSVRGSSEPLFSSTAFAGYQPTMNKIIAETLEIASKDPKAGVELVDLFEPMNLQILGETIFGMDFRCVGQEMSKLGKSAAYLMKPSSQGGVTWITYAFLALPDLRTRLAKYLNKQGAAFPVFAKALKNTGYIFGASKALLVASRGDPNDDPYNLGEELMPKENEILLPGDKVQLEGVHEGIADYQGTIPGEDSFIARMLRSIQKEGPNKGKPLSDLQIATNAVGVILAGFETTALGIAYTLYELAKDPVAQQKCRDEVKAFYEEHGQDYELTYKDMDKFKWCSACYHEGMRVAYPGIAPALGTREVNEDITLGKWFIPKGSSVIMNVNGIFMDEQIWPNPKVFRPERFLEDNKVDGPSTRHPAAFSPFGYGPRKCIGAKLAITESIFTVIAISRHFTYSVDLDHHPNPAAPIPKRMGVTLTPLNGIWLRFKRLSGESSPLAPKTPERANHKATKAI